MAGLEPLLQTTVVKYHFANSKTAWEIRERDVVMVEGCQYLKLRRGGTNQGFPRIVFDSCEDLELELRSLAHSFG